MKVTIISSFAQDILIKDDGIEKNEGGPALFITNFLRKKGIEYDLVTGKKGIVEIDMRENREVGKINNMQKFLAIPTSVNGLVIYSSLLDEFPLRRIGDVNCVDVQGYVRDKNVFGGKKYFDDESLKGFDIVKGTKEEISFINEDILKTIKLVVITSGSKGFDIISNSEKQSFDVDKVSSKDTIGAGDTFFVAFCTKYFETKDLKESANYAKDEARNFLINKK